MIAIFVIVILRMSSRVERNNTVKSDHKKRNGSEIFLFLFLLLLLLWWCNLSAYTKLQVWLMAATREPTDDVRCRILTTVLQPP